MQTALCPPKINSGWVLRLVYAYFSRKPEPDYAYNRYAKKKHVLQFDNSNNLTLPSSIYYRTHFIRCKKCVENVKHEIETQT